MNIFIIFYLADIPVVPGQQQGDEDGLENPEESLERKMENPQLEKELY